MIDSIKAIPTVQSLSVDSLSASSNTQKPSGVFFREIIGKLNETSSKSENLKSQLVKGEPGVDITDVMIASQEAKMALTTVIEVRNKAIEAYKEVISMPV